MAQVVTLMKSSPRMKRSKLKKDEKRPEWNDAISDLSIHRPTPQELERKRLMCKSKNAELAKMALLKKDLHKLNKKNEGNGKDKEKNVMFEPDNKSGDSTKDPNKKISRSLNGSAKSNGRSSPVKFAGKPMVTLAPRSSPAATIDSMSSFMSTPKIGDKQRLSSPQSRQRSPCSSDSSPIRRIGRCANRLQLICNGSDHNLSEQRVDNLVQVLKKLSAALDALESQVNPTVDEEGDKPQLDSKLKDNATAFNEQLLSEFCRLVNLFQKVTQQLDKERNLREELSQEVVRQGTLIKELSVELLQIECQQQSQPSTERKEDNSFVVKRKSRGDALGPETCMMKRNKRLTEELNCDKLGSEMKHAYTSKGSVSLPDVRDRSPCHGKTPTGIVSNAMAKRRAADGLNSGLVSTTNDHQSRKRSQLAITVSASRGPFMKGGEEMAAAIISTVCSTDGGEMRGLPASNATSLTYIVDENGQHSPAIMLTLPQQCDMRSLSFDPLTLSPDVISPRRRSSNSFLVGEAINSDLVLLEMNASWLPDSSTLQSKSPNNWATARPGFKRWPEALPEPLPPPPSREQSPLSSKAMGLMGTISSETSSPNGDDENPLVSSSKRRVPFSFEDSNPLDLFQESTDNSITSHTLEADRDSNVVTLSSPDEDFGSSSDNENASDRLDTKKSRQDVEEVKRRLDMEELLNKLEALQTHYMSAHIKLQSLVERSSSTSDSPSTSDTEVTGTKSSSKENELSPNCEKKQRCQQNG